MKTNEQIFDEIREQGFMTEQQMNLLKRRSNASGKDLMDYEFIESIGDGYGIPLTEEQGRKGLVWLYKQMRKRNKVTDVREDEIISTANPSDFRFVCFYDAGNYWRKNFIPVYNLNGMEYYVRGGELCICG